MKLSKIAIAAVIASTMFSGYTMANNVQEALVLKENQSSGVWGAIQPYPITICSDSQIKKAQVWSESCKTVKNGVKSNVCTLVAVNRICTPTTRAVAQKYGVLMSTGFGKNQNKYKNTYRYKEVEVVTPPPQETNVNSYVCDDKSRDKISVMFERLSEKESDAININRKIDTYRSIICQSIYKEPSIKERTVTTTKRIELM